MKIHMQIDANSKERQWIIPAQDKLAFGFEAFFVRETIEFTGKPVDEPVLKCFAVGVNQDN